MKKVVLVIAAHADDEALGCGAVMARHVEEGDCVRSIFLADGVRSRKKHKPRALRQRLSAAQKAQKILGALPPVFLGFPDNQMDKVPLLKIVQKLEQSVQKIKPDIIYTHFHGDLNIDHQITHHAVMTVFRPQPNVSVRKIYGFEVLSSTEWKAPQNNPFLPNHFVDIEKYLKIKKEALKAYRGEMRASPHSRSLKHVEHLAGHRGHSVGIKAAEAFVVYRQLR